MAHIVPEPMRRLAQAIGTEHRRVGNSAQREDHLEARHCAEFRLQVEIALSNLGGDGLVGRRQATDGVRDPAIVQVKPRVRPAVCAKRLASAGKPEAMECRVKQLSRHVAGKWSPGTVGATFARSKANDEKTGIERPE